MEKKLIVNPGKDEFVTIDANKYSCYAIKTHTITKNDSLFHIIDQYVSPLITKEDIVFISEKMVACTEGRAYQADKIKAGFVARMLSRCVKRSANGIGLAMPETMQCAIDETGLVRILVAAFAGMVGKLLHRHGWFYKIAGRKAAAIDGPCSYTLPPYNKYIVLAPADPCRTACDISDRLGGNTVLIIDANDLGCEILGTSDQKTDVSIYKKLLRQNPLGQSTQSTPIGILRPCHKTIKPPQ
ncbi:MAG: F420-0--gamma-glutamyl ligase [Clostridiales bacterium]|nr:F420-0--gamma-glutamyl ligase [Clostridiales bacterium]